MPPPHIAHHNPWAHATICCDQERGESTSMNQLSASSFPHPAPEHKHHAGCSECPMDTYCCSGDYCCDGEEGGEECCVDSQCEEPHEVAHKSCGHDECGENGMKCLEEWAGTTEGCNAIKQLLECCNQPDCDIPVCPTDNAEIHPPLLDPLAALFDSMAAPQPISVVPPNNGNIYSSATTPVSAAEAASHTCHWGNCHLLFRSMPDLLAHVASDHLSAWGTAMRSGELLRQAHESHAAAQQVQQAVIMPSMGPLGLSTGEGATVTSEPALGPSIQGSPVNGSTATRKKAAAAAAAAAKAESDQILACMWDDCFPLADLGQTAVGMFHQYQSTRNSGTGSGGEAGGTHAGQTHSDQGLDDHKHSHMSAAGEPFSPNTMLRHVLSEHLGVPPDLIGWPSEAEAAAAAAEVAAGHHHHHVTEGGLPHPHEHMNPSHSHSHPHPHPHPHGHHHHHPPHIHDNFHPLPTPPSTVHTEPSTSPPAPGRGRTSLADHASDPGSLVCLWPGCTIAEPFTSTAALMDHLSDVHIPKGKDSYVCRWDGCGGEQGRTFMSRQKVLRHLQSHTGHKPFVCGVCHQAFSEAAPLSAHMRRHAQEKPFRCEHPGCGKTFAISSSLTIHMRMHSGEKPFICPHCQKGFVEASNLTKHIRTHTGERPFGCRHPGCGKKFSRPDQLKRHMSVHDKLAGEKRKGSGVATKQL